MITISNTYKIKFENLIFSNNRISSQVVNIEKCVYLIFKNLTCENMNLIHLEDDFLALFSKGGCFRSENVIYREIINMNIFNISSKNTTSGFKAIDKNDEIENFNVDFEYNIQKKQVVYCY